MLSVQEGLTFSDAAKTSGGGGPRGPLKYDLLMGSFFILLLMGSYVLLQETPWLHVVALLLPGLPTPNRSNRYRPGHE